MSDNKFDLLIFDWEGTLANVHLSLKMNQGAKLFDGVELGIKNLKRQGYLLSIATGKGIKSLNQDLIDTNLKDDFLISKTVDDCFSKPHPQMILEILNYTMVDAKKALMIGDSSCDLEMAKNAGIGRTVRVLDVSEKRSNEIIADQTVDSIAEMVVAVREHLA